MTGQRIKQDLISIQASLQLYPMHLLGYAVIAVLPVWVTARIGLVEPATGCMVCLTVSVHADSMHTSIGTFATGTATAELQLQQFGAYPVTTACTGFVQHLAWQAGTPRTVCLQETCIMRYNVLNNSCRKLAADCLHAVMLLRPAQVLTVQVAAIHTRAV
jgi:hypothetical protein